jgi:Uma2 family endonuclease
MTTRPDPSRFTADAFIAWAADQPAGRFELVRGEVVAMAPERAAHARTKARAHRALEDAVAAAGLRCEAFPDGMTVRIDDRTVYEPDALVRCGPPTPDDAVEIPDPVVVVEVVSRSSRATDSGVKLADYFTLPSVRHYLVLDADARAATHHRRGAGRDIATRILRAGRLELDPPGLSVEVAELFPTAGRAGGGHSGKPASP